MQENEHGGNIRKMAGEAGCSPEDILDFSANINPLGPPSWLPGLLQDGVHSLQHYPDPAAETACSKAAEHFALPEKEIICGNGSSELLDAVLRACGLSRAVIPVPAYIDYEQRSITAGLRIQTVPLCPEDGFVLDMQEIRKHLETPAAVILGQPNNPTGIPVDPEEIRRTARAFPGSLFIIDEAFADFIPDLDRLYRERPENVLVLYSLTKFFSVPGLRVGMAFGEENLIRAMQNLLPDWTVNSLAQEFICRALGDDDFFRESMDKNLKARENLQKELGNLDLQVFPGRANFLFCRLPQGISASDLRRFLLEKHRIAVRLCSNYSGLDDGYFRIAVRREEENKKLITAMQGFLRPPGPRRTRGKPAKTRKPALMIQGTCSNAGKSILAAGFCRLFLQEGLDPAPFKSQNMSLNSFVTRDGLEMGRAQVVQALACRLDPSADMNPVLLKPSSDTGSQVIVQGRAVGNMHVGEYFAYKQGLWEKIHQSYKRVEKDADIMVLEGAGSPAEINLKSQDIVNMRLAEWAKANVLIAGDIDRGGVFASIAGTMALLEPGERKMVRGFIINKFRGQKELLDPALQHCRLHNRRPVLGVIPYIPDLGLPDEDSVSLKADPALDFPDREINIGFVDLPHLSNLNDLEPLGLEPDVGLQVIQELKPEHFQLDALVIPGSKNVIQDFKQLKKWGVNRLVSGLLDQNREVIGICGGFQMLGTRVSDPHGIESGQVEVSCLGILPMRTTLQPEKHLLQTFGKDKRYSCPVRGYEIHHGQTEPENGLIPVMTAEDGTTLGLGHETLPVWGTYMHGVFDSDEFRRSWLNNLRRRKGLKPFFGAGAAYDLEPALDRLADIIRENTDIKQIFKFLGI
jgi:cobyric acid synthase CobQ/L-threonine-O-3-phosphate decarboxylase